MVLLIKLIQWNNLMFGIVFNVLFLLLQAIFILLRVSLRVVVELNGHLIFILISLSLYLEVRNRLFKLYQRVIRRMPLLSSWALTEFAQVESLAYQTGVSCSNNWRNPANVTDRLIVHLNFRLVLLLDVRLRHFDSFLKRFLHIIIHFANDQVSNSRLRDLLFSIFGFHDSCLKHFLVSINVINWVVRVRNPLIWECSI